MIHIGLTSALFIGGVVAHLSRSLWDVLSENLRLWVVGCGGGCGQSDVLSFSILTSLRPSIFQRIKSQSPVFYSGRRSSCTNNLCTRYLIILHPVSYYFAPGILLFCTRYLRVWLATRFFRAFVPLYNG
jgi:hypothetical protein